jgi:hypothetical protein
MIMSIENLARKPSIPVPQFRGIEYSRTQHGPSMAYTSQREFHDARDRFKGFSGPIGSGKSKALCHEALQLAYVNHGCLGVIGAPTYPMLRDATLTAFLEILEDNQVPYQFNKSEYSLVLPEVDSTILFRSLDSFERIRGTNLAWFGVDELTYCKPEAWLRLEGRLRSPSAQRLQGFAVWTPKGFDWVYERFIGPDRVPGYKAVLAAPGENTALPSDFYERLKISYDPRLYQQEVLGQYLSIFSDAAYFSFDRERNVQPVQYTPGVPLAWSLDFNVNPMCSVISQLIDITDRADVLSGRQRKVIYVLDEIALPDADINAACAEFVVRTEPWRRFGQLTVYLYGDSAGNARSHSGPTDWQVVKDYFRNDSRFVFVHKVARSHPLVKDRVNQVNAMILNARGERRLFIDPRAKELIRDLEQVVWKADKSGNLAGNLDKRDPARTHSSDALGYLIDRECPLREQGGPRSTVIT